MLQEQPGPSWSRQIVPQQFSLSFCLSQALSLFKLVILISVSNLVYNSSGVVIAQSLWSWAEKIPGSRADKTDKTGGVIRAPSEFCPGNLEQSTKPTNAGQHKYKIAGTGICCHD